MNYREIDAVGAVVATASVLPIDIQKLRYFLVQHVAAFKVPERICYYDGAMPRIASGKIAKKIVREEIIANRFGEE